MTGNKNGGPEKPPEPPDNVRKLPVRPRTQDQDRAAGKENLRAIAMAKESHATNLRNTPIRARLLHVLTQQTEIYNQIKESQQYPNMRLWITAAPAGGTGIPALQTFYQGVPQDEKVLTIGMLQSWLFNTFGHLRPLYPQVFSEGDIESMDSVFIKWDQSPPDGETEPSPPLMA